MRSLKSVLQKSPMGLLLLAAIVVGAAVVFASDSVTVGYGTNQSITAFSTCKKVTNNSATGLSVYVPQTTAAEWLSFYSSPPNAVLVQACQGLVVKSSVLPTARNALSCVTDTSTGKIYCIGGSSDAVGFGNNTTLNQIIEYDPVTDVTTIKSAVLPQGIEWHSCAYLASVGKIYCFSGAKADGLANTAIYEYTPATNIMLTKPTTAPTVIFGGSCVASNTTNTIFCFGGMYNGVSNSNVYEYNPVANTMIAKLAGAEPYYQNSCATNPVTGKIYCFGGANSANSAYNAIYEYTPASNTSSLKSAVLPVALAFLSCAGNANGKIYCFGGTSNNASYVNGTWDWAQVNTIVSYDPSSNTVATHPLVLPTKRDQHSCSANASFGNIYCFGGSFMTGDLFSPQIVLYKTITEFTP